MSVLDELPTDVRLAMARAVEGQRGDDSDLRDLAETWVGIHGDVESRRREAALTKVPLRVMLAIAAAVKARGGDFEDFESLALIWLDAFGDAHATHDREGGRP